MKCRSVSTYLQQFESKKIRNEKVAEFCEALYYKQFFSIPVFTHEIVLDSTHENGGFVTTDYNFRYNPYWKDKAEKLHDCGSFLNFARNVDDIDDLKLVGANFCRLRICPMCAWRRQARLYSEMVRMMEIITDKEKLSLLDLPKKYLHKSINYQFLMVTFTLKNCVADDLGDTIDTFIDSYSRRLLRTKRIKSFLYGSYRALEVTYNHDSNTFHPHIHAIWVVPSSYFSHKGKYLTQEELADLWQSCTDIDYTPVVDIRKIKTHPGMDSNDIGGVVAEVCKYPVKDEDFCDYDNIESSLYVLENIDKFLKGRRLVSFGGLFKLVRKYVLAENQNNICLSDSCKELLDDINVGNEYIIDSYIWRSGYHFADFGEKYFDWYKSFHGKIKGGDVK